MSASSTTPPLTVGDVQGNLEALQADVDIFWLLFGAILVFCELIVS